MNEISIKPNTVLLRPRVTEKAALASDKGVYVFDVTAGATRKSVSASVADAYGVTPEKVRLLTMPRKKVFVRGNWGRKGGGKKAYVYLKKGDKIEVM